MCGKYTKRICFLVRNKIGIIKLLLKTERNVFFTIINYILKILLLYLVTVKRRHRCLTGIIIPPGMFTTLQVHNITQSDKNCFAESVKRK